MIPDRAGLEVGPSRLSSSSSRILRYQARVESSSVFRARVESSQHKIVGKNTVFLQKWNFFFAKLNCTQQFVFTKNRKISCTKISKILAGKIGFEPLSREFEPGSDQPLGQTFEEEWDSPLRAAARIGARAGESDFDISFAILSSNLLLLRFCN